MNCIFVHKKFGGLKIIYPVLIVIALTGVASILSAQEFERTYYIPLPENELRTNLTNFASPSNQIETVVSITTTDNDIIIYYDHWEDGYEADIFNPVQATTEIWGDNNTSNGFPSTIMTDILTAGDVISLRNTITLPRNPSTIQYDGRDKLVTKDYVTITKSNWAISPGPVLAGAVEVYDTLLYGTNYTVPIGENTPNSLQQFENSSLFIMAVEDNTSVQIDADANGSFEINTILNQGENYYINNGVLQGAKVQADKKIQTHLLTGDIGATYEARWFALNEISFWDNTYYTPVGTTLNEDATDIFIYNPNNTAITININTVNATASVIVPPNGSTKYRMPFNSGAELRSAGGEIFAAISSIDSDNTANGSTTHDWGFSLLAEAYLTTQVAISWGPGTGDIPPASNGSPVWVTSPKQTLVYIDYDGDPTTGANTDINGRQYDLTYDLQPYESFQIFDPDNDATGLLLYNLEGNGMAVAWGQDPSMSAGGNPYLDLGVAIQPLRQVVPCKFMTLVTDNDNDGFIGYNDIVEYTIRLDNQSFELREFFVVVDTLPNEVAYIPNTTTYNGVAYPDDTLGATPFPFDEGGGDIDSIYSRQGNDILFQVRIKTPVEVGSGFNEIVNTISMITNIGEYIKGQSIDALSTDISSCNLDLIDNLGSVASNYLVNETICIRITDADQNLNDSQIDSVRVVVYNSSVQDFENLILYEVAANAGIFEACLISSTASGQSSNDGVLFITAGETVQVDYKDILFGETCSGSANFIPPVETKSLYLTEPGQGLDRIDPVNSTPVDNSTATSIVLGNNMPTPITFSTILSMGSDDAREEVGGGNVQTGDSNIELGVKINGFRFQNITIPQGTTIDNAYIEFEVANTSNETTNLTIHGEDIDTAPTFSDTNLDITGRTKTSANVAWNNIPAWNNTGVKEQTPSITSIVQEILNRSGWTSGNAMAFVIEGTGKRIVEAFESDPNKAALLVIEYSTQGGGGATTTSFVQTTPMCSNLEIPNGGAIDVSLYINELTGTIGMSPNIVLLLSHGSTPFAKLGNPSYNSLTNLMVWNGSAMTDLTLPANEAVTLEIFVEETGYTFEIEYDSNTKPSKIDLQTTTVISIDDYGIYDAPYPNGTPITAAINSESVYVRTSISDPFGYEDITSVDLEIIDPNNSSSNIVLGMGEEVNTMGCTKIYEYVWNTPAIQGNYQVKAIANEGYEDTVKDSASTAINLNFLDVGTPCSLEFQDNGGSTVMSFPSTANQVCIQVQDFDQDTSNTVQTLSVSLQSDANDLEDLTLTETGLSTGVFIGCINFSSSTIGNNNDNELYGPPAAVLTATYSDPDVPSDVCTEIALVESPTPAIAVNNIQTIPVSDSIVQVGDTVVFEIQLSNPGQTTITNYTLTDVFDNSCLSYRSASISESNTTTNSISWTENELGAIAPATTLTFSVVFDAISECTNTNTTVSVTASDNLSNMLSAGPAMDAITITNPEIVVNKVLLSPSSDPYHILDTLWYEITIKNTGSTAIDLLPLSDYFSNTCLEFIDSDSLQDGVGGGTIVWTNLGDLSVGDSVVLHVRFRAIEECSEARNIAQVNLAIDENGDPVPGISDTVIISIENRPPIAINNLDTTFIDTDTFSLVLANDIEPDSQNLQLIGAGTDAINGNTSAGGIITINDNGTASDSNDDYINYTPPAGFIGLDTFYYQICDEAITPLCDTATVVFTVRSFNDPPFAQMDLVTVNEDTPVILDVQSNDSDPDGDPLTTTIIGASAQGVTPTVLNGDSISYTPPMDYAGMDTITYEVCDNGSPMLCDTAIVVITLTPVNDPPIANDDSLMIDEDMSITLDVQVNDTDPDNDPLTTSLIGTSTQGVTPMVLNGDSIAYTPPLNYAGKDTVTYQVCDTGMPILCDTAMVVLTMDQVNDHPMATNDADTTYEGITKIVEVQFNDVDVENHLLITRLLASTAGSMPTIINNDSISYEPPFNFIGIDTVSYEVCDNGMPVLCDTALLIMTVLELHPVAVNDSTTTIMNFGPLVIDWDNNDTIVDNGILVSYDMTSAQGGTVIDNGNGTFTYTSSIGYSGGDSFTYTICDDDIPVPNCSTAAVSITIIEQNQCISGLYQVISDTIKLLDVTANPATYVIVASPPPESGFNATGYNSKDGLIYGYVRGGPIIYSFNLTTNVFTPVYTHAEGNSNFVGDFDIDGNLYYTNSGRTTLYKLNVATGVRTDINMTTGLGASDVAFLPGVGGDSDLLIGVTNGNQLVEYNIDDNTTTKTNLTGPITSETGSFGAAWIVEGTKLYVFNNASGNIYFIDINTKVSTFQTSSQPNNSNDGMSCLFGIDPFDVSNTLDYGDAPDTYGTLEASNGAAAITNISFKLGNLNDIDTLALPTIDADGDDTDAEGNDDDGVHLNGSSLQGQLINIGESYMISINAPIGFGYISAWIDWNRNGIFDPTEAIAIDSSATNKIINIPITVPVDANSGTTYARFRLAARTGASPTGLYSFGEVEDYKIEINSPPIVLPTPLTVSQDSTGEVCLPILDVNDGNTFTAIVCGVENGLVNYLITDNEICLTYTPSLTYSGTDSICLVVCDNFNACDSTIVPITVTPALASDPTPTPPIVIPTPITIPQDSMGKICTPIIDSNVGDTFTAVLCSGSPDNGTAVPTVMGNELCLSYTPNTGFVGTDPVCIIVCDQTNLCDTIDIPVMVIPTPAAPDSMQAPIVSAPPIVTQTDSIVQICGSITDVNILDTHTAIICEQPTNGAITTATIDNSNDQICLTFTPDTGFIGTDSTCLIVCDQTNLCDTITIPIVVLPSVTQLKISALLQGGLLGGTDTLMRDDLRQQNFIPLIQPYTMGLHATRFLHQLSGYETTNLSTLAANSNTPDAIVDWVFLELRNSQDSSSVFRTLSALVQRDGDIVNASTGGDLLVNGIPPSFFVSIKHRNHLGVMTANPITATNGIACVDFREATNIDLYHLGIYDGLEMATINGKRALWAANNLIDTKVKYDGSFNDRIQIGNNVLTHIDNLSGVLNFNNSLGYLLGDVNLDGKSKYDGGNNDRLMLQNIILTYPLNTNFLNNYNNMIEQLPE